MRRASIIVAAICIGLTFNGCGSTKPPQPAAENQVDKPGPDGVVFTFLEAVRTGNADKATSLLSPLAREKTAEKGASIAPPSSETASFQVGAVEIVGEGGAHVASTWTDLDEEGKPHSDQVIWMVRKEPEGWRIVGMATRLFPDEPPLFLNFEDPDDMLRKQRLAQEEIERRARGEIGKQQSPPETARRSPKSVPSENPLRRQ